MGRKRGIKKPADDKGKQRDDCFKKCGMKKQMKDEPRKMKMTETDSKM